MTDRVGTLVEDTRLVPFCQRCESVGKHPTVKAKHPPGEPPLNAGTTACFRHGWRRERGAGEGREGC